MNFEEYQVKLVESVGYIRENRFDDAIVLAKAILKGEACLNNPPMRIWPAGVFVSARLLKINAEGQEPHPGSDDYRELYQSIKLVLEDFEKLNLDDQENYKSSNIHFALLRPLYQLMQAGKPLSTLGADQDTPKKSGCAGIIILFFSLSASAVALLLA